MRTRVLSLLAILALTTISCVAQRTVRVEAMSNDISNNLDLQAVASVFGDSRNLEDFERRINDYDSRISNLDLNNDGEVDYLRVVENYENYVHVIIIQAILDTDIYQDVATIVVERNNRRVAVQIIGDPYIYGETYIVEPVYYYRPLIYSYFGRYNYQCWHSPYNWGYYPRHYRHYHPCEINFYYKHIYAHVNHDHKYYYSNTYHNSNYRRLQTSISRNDFSRRNPDQSFIRRNANTNVVSKRDFDRTRTSNTIVDRQRPVNQSTQATTGRGSRGEGTRNADEIYQTPSSRAAERQSQNTDYRNTGAQQSRTNAQPANDSRASGSRTTQPNVQQNQNNASQSTRSYPSQNTSTQSTRQIISPERKVVEINRNTQPARTNESYRSSQPLQQRPAAVTESPRTQTRVNTESSGSRNSNSSSSVRSNQSEQRRTENSQSGSRSSSSRR